MCYWSNFNVCIFNHIGSSCWVYRLFEKYYPSSVDADDIPLCQYDSELINDYYNTWIYIAWSWSFFWIHHLYSLNYWHYTVFISFFHKFDFVVYFKKIEFHKSGSVSDGAMERWSLFRFRKQSLRIWHPYIFTFYVFEFLFEPFQNQISSW